MPAAAITTTDSSSLLTTKRRDLLALDTQKKSLQCEAEAIVSELTSQLPEGGPPIGIDSPLVDAEGFPRADIDVYRARTLRKRFKEIQTDHKALEKKIEVGLVEIAALSSSESKQQNSISATTDKDDEEEKKARLAPKPKPKFDPKTGKWVVKSWDGSVAGVKDGEKRSFDDLGATSTAALATTVGGSNNSNVGNAVSDGGGNGIQQQQPPSVQQMQQVSFQEESTIPFAIIDEISPDSPASLAGLKENDVLLRFGSVNNRNHRNFLAIAELLPIAASENKSISVAVRRKSTELGGLVEVIKTEKLELKPRPWGGRGLLGCHIRPYSE
ncbi:hypothetical protein ACHAXR_003869 [Thalassiosira sp. AJA248-18]